MNKFSTLKPRVNERMHTVAPQTIFTLEKQYCDLKPIGSGSYGVVCSARDGKGKKVAIKKITPMCKHIGKCKQHIKLIRTSSRLIIDTF
jgi:hypothetical protein